MEICKYDDIVYDTSSCPLCEANGRIQELEDELESAKEDVGDLSTQNEKLEDRIKELESIIEDLESEGIK